jgi:hypothetical protein
MRRTVTTVGPKDDGRSMSLVEFDLAEVQPGYNYELSRGTIDASDIPNQPHLAQIKEVKRQVHGYDYQHPGRIELIATGSECKILIPSLESERHPDLAIYKSIMPLGSDIWSIWIPDIVIEIVSASSEFRDYVEKREEYFKFGVREYWILNAFQRELRVLKRAGDDWSDHIIRPPKLYKSRLLPGFAFDCALVFAAAEEAGL